MMGEYDAGYENCINSMVNEAADIQFRIDSLQAESEQLRELVVRMARALDIDGDWCNRECYAEFRCTGSCAIADKLVELGIAEVVE